MIFIEILFLAIALSMDSFAVSMSSGIMIRRFKWEKALKIALYFAIFQSGMPLIGYLAGESFSVYIQNYDHWIAFYLLLLLGLKMIYEALPKKNKEHKFFNPTKTRTLITLALATSVDALAIGISFSLLKLSLVTPTITIWLTTFIFSVFGVYIGTKFGERMKSGVEAFGGVILIVIGSKILFEHLHLIS